VRVTNLAWGVLQRIGESGPQGQQRCAVAAACVRPELAAAEAQRWRWMLATTTTVRPSMHCGSSGGCSRSRSRGERIRSSGSRGAHGCGLRACLAAQGRTLWQWSRGAAATNRFRRRRIATGARRTLWLLLLLLLLLLSLLCSGTRCG
jgi:hypothetical protein